MSRDLSWGCSGNETEAHLSDDSRPCRPGCPETVASLQPRGARLPQGEVAQVDRDGLSYNRVEMHQEKRTPMRLGPQQRGRLGQVVDGSLSGSGVWTAEQSSNGAAVPSQPQTASQGEGPERGVCVLRFVLGAGLGGHMLGPCYHLHFRLTQHLSLSWLTPPHIAPEKSTA